MIVKTKCWVQVAAFTIVACALPLVPAKPQELVEQSLSHNGVERSYFIQRRNKSDTRPKVAGKRPLLVVLHGARGRARSFAGFTGFLNFAGKEGFVAVFPQGLNRVWNDGRKFKSRRPRITDDVGFLKALVRKVIAANPAIDPARVFVAGISNGGFMAMRLACEAPEMVAGIAAVTAQLSKDTADRCRPALPVPVLIMNGTEDPLVPYKGGVVLPQFGGRGRVISTLDTARFWARHNGCAQEVQAIWLPDRDPSDRSRVEFTAWEGCRDRASVRLYRIAGGGHTWPGKLQYLPVLFIGRTNRDIDGSKVIWRFFKSLPPRRR